MQPKEALEILKQCGAAHIGKLGDHQAIQTALQVLSALVNPTSDEANPE